MDEETASPTVEPQPQPPWCEICRDFIPIDSNPDASMFEQWLKVYQIDPKTLNENCHRCRLLNAIFHKLETCLETDYPDVEFVDDGQGQSKCMWLSPGPDEVVTARCTWTGKTKPGAGLNDDSFERSVSIVPADQSDMPANVAAETLKNLQWSSKSEESLQFLKDMLHTCELGQGDHELCFQQNPELPARLVQILDGESLQLYETQPEERGTYIALSHCWGPRDKLPIRTTKQTIQQFSESISWSDLSKVFQDAVWLSKLLGIGYIWIDSLCIVQDDEQDWETESTKMAQYYSGAHLTISAETSPDGSVPFIGEIEERWQRMVYSTHDRNGHSCNYMVQEQHMNQLYTFQAENYYKAGCNLLPHRAWTLQESVLSSRVVHFTPSSLIWHCRGKTACEDEHRVLGVGMSEWNAQQAVHTLFNLTGSDEENRKGASKLWNTLVWQYTQRKCTFASDRLPAIGGIAESLAPKFPGRYLAGIWEAQLPYGLCWSRESEVPDLGLREVIAATWAWASLPPGVRITCPLEVAYTELEPEYRPKVLEAFCETSKVAPFGRVRGGHMVMEAPLFEVKITCTAPYARVPDFLKYHVSFGQEIGDFRGVVSTVKEDCLLAMQNGNVVRATEEQQVEYKKDPAKFQATAWVVWINGTMEAALEGLMLGRDEGSGEYWRIGHLRLDCVRKDIFPDQPLRSQIKLV
ncbi:hypothetical protein LCI18_007574 [Fusarium solani-melongenae]|uniref:Uncharacterized protein n=1 Tax=Fusarium solani subsp. cucurbitae TaxID=2747967 RepID=A0ACD3Z5U4_FUSSC|nr:hypothetical protein LCI18_007574 [Fusarium solani-melongenae]